MGWIVAWSLSGLSAFINGATHRLRGPAIDKTCHLRLGVINQSNPEACSRLSLCCRPRLVWCAVAVIAVGAHMVIGGIGEFLHGLVQLILRPEFVQIRAFVFQSVEMKCYNKVVTGVANEI